MAESTSPSTPSASSLDSSSAQDVVTELYLGELQSEEHRRVLDMVAQLRKCGLDNVLSLPQIVACGDQSSGKSSLLAALTGIEFEQSDGLCTRFATEIHLRDSDKVYIKVRVIPDSSRGVTEKRDIEAFEQSIQDFCELPKIMRLAKEAMGLGFTKVGKKEHQQPRVFARDVLSIEFGSPKSPQLTLVDIPGLIAASSKGITKADVAMVTEITDHYITQPRTICLAVVSAKNDYSNQLILEKVREVDPDGNRTLGVITKPDTLPASSLSEAGFIQLALNKDIVFKLGWHVLRNRTYEERDCSLEEHGFRENLFFSKSSFSVLPKDIVGIDSLILRLSQLLFEHIKNELPKLYQDLEGMLDEVDTELKRLGTRRSTASECKSYLSHISMDFHRIAELAVKGHYGHKYFQKNIDPAFSLTSRSTICRTRAVVYLLNLQFTTSMHYFGRKYIIPFTNEVSLSPQHLRAFGDMSLKRPWTPQQMTKEEGIEWVRQALIRNRGQELPGTFNPLLIEELFWEQSSKWVLFAESHVDIVFKVCSSFLKNLLQDLCPKDVSDKLWATLVEDKLKQRKKSALEELDKLVKDLEKFPINHNHYYTGSVEKRRAARMASAVKQIATAADKTSQARADAKEAKTENADEATTVESESEGGDSDGEEDDFLFNRQDLQQAIAAFSLSDNNQDMDYRGCEEALDGLFGIYKVEEKKFVANVVMQVIERHIVHDLPDIFSPFVVNKLSDNAAETIASEPLSAKRKRDFLEDQSKILLQGREIFRSVL